MRACKYLIFLKIIIVLLQVNAYPLFGMGINTLDSLKSKLYKHSPNDTLKVDILNSIAFSYFSIDNDSLFAYSEKARLLADYLNYQKGLAQSYNMVGLHHWMNSDYQIALNYHEDALIIAEEIDDKLIISDCYYYIGNVYREWGDFEEAYNYLQEALAAKSEIDDLSGTSNVYNSIGTVYRIQGDYAKALDYCQKSLRIKENTRDSIGLATVYNSLGSVYYYQNRYDEAKDNYYKSFEIANKIGDKKGVVTSYNNLGIIYFFQENYEKSLDLFYQSLIIQQEIGDKTGSAISLINIGEVYTIKNDFDKAWEYYNKGLVLSREIGIKSVEGWSYWGFANIRFEQKRFKDAFGYSKRALKVGETIGEIEMAQQSAEIASKSSAALGLYKDAYEYNVVFKELSDSIRNEENTRQVVGLEYEYKFENERIEQQKREAEQLAKYQRQKFLTVIFIVSFTLVLGLAIVVLLSFRRKHRDYKIISEQKNEIERKNNLLEQQKEEIASQNETLQRWNREVTAKNEKIYNQKRQLEEQAVKLKALDEIKSRFFTNISHELRTPLTLILGPVEQLIEQCADSQVKSTLRLIHCNAQNLLGLINQLLDISRIERGVVKMRLRKGSISAELALIVEMFTSHAQSKGVEIKFISQVNDDVYYYDKEKLERIMYNLISNAVKNTDDGSITILLKDGKKQGEVQIEVADTGKGIEEEKLPYIFDRFYMANESGGMGSGIGLSFASELVKIYKGNIAVQSKLGKGTTFTLTIPKSKDAFSSNEIEPVGVVNESLSSHLAMPEVAEGNPACKESSSRKYVETILLVEDHDDLRRFIATSLDGNYRVLEAENGRIGIEVVKKEMPDLIVTDVMMPEVDGIELTRTIKSNSETSHIPIVMLTAKASEDSRIQGLETEADDYLTKPFSYRELNVRIQNLLKSRRKLRQKYMRSLEVNPSEITTNSLDEQFVISVLKIVEENMSNPEFSVEQLCEKASIARTTLHNKLRSLLGQSATEFINSIRVKRAAQLIKQKAGTISEIAYDVGYNNLSYFTKQFKKHFNATPSDMMERP